MRPRRVSVCPQQRRGSQCKAGRGGALPAQACEEPVQGVLVSFSGAQGRRHRSTQPHRQPNLLGDRLRRVRPSSRRAPNSGVANAIEDRGSARDACVPRRAWLQIGRAAGAMGSVREREGEASVPTLVRACGGRMCACTRLHRARARLKRTGSENASRHLFFRWVVGTKGPTRHRAPRLVLSTRRTGSSAPPFVQRGATSAYGRERRAPPVPGEASDPLHLS